MNQALESTEEGGELTDRQRQVLNFVQVTQETTGLTPTLREIAAHFGFQSMNAAADHVRALRRKGVLAGGRRRARSLQVAAAWKSPPLNLVSIPIFGSIPAGFADHRQQESVGCIAVDAATLGIRPSPRSFALEVRGDSMIGKHILPGDVVVLEHGMTPQPGDVVAALIDNESTLKTFVLDQGQPCLKAENPRYPRLIPLQELVIQGVMVALIRRRRVRKRA